MNENENTEMKFKMFFKLMIVFTLIIISMPLIVSFCQDQGDPSEAEKALIQAGKIQRRTAQVTFEHIFSEDHIQKIIGAFLALSKDSDSDNKRFELLETIIWKNTYDNYICSWYKKDCGQTIQAVQENRSEYFTDKGLDPRIGDSLKISMENLHKTIAAFIKKEDALWSFYLRRKTPLISFLSEKLGQHMEKLNFLLWLQDLEQAATAALKQEIRDAFNSYVQCEQKIEEMRKKQDNLLLEKIFLKKDMSQLMGDARYFKMLENNPRKPELKQYCEKNPKLQRSYTSFIKTDSALNDLKKMLIEVLLEKEDKGEIIRQNTPDFYFTIFLLKQSETNSKLTAVFLKIIRDLSKSLNNSFGNILQEDDKTKIKTDESAP